jgi:hypothetical protein
VLAPCRPRSRIEALSRPSSLPASAVSRGLSTAHDGARIVNHTPIGAGSFATNEASAPVSSVVEPTRTGFTSGSSREVPAYCFFVTIPVTATARIPPPRS